MTDYDKAFKLLEDVRECELQLTMAKELLMKHLQGGVATATPVSLEPPSAEEAPGYEATNDALEALTESMNPVDPVATKKAKRQRIRFTGRNRPRRIRRRTGEEESWYSSGGYRGCADALNVGTPQAAGRGSPTGKRGIWLTKEELSVVRERSENMRSIQRQKKNKQSSTTSNRFSDRVVPKVLRIPKS